jgi:methyl-accepting chemotaxis protein
MPEATRNQSEILERLGTVLNEQADKAQQLLDTFKEVSGKLDNIPNGNAEQARILSSLTGEVQKAVEQETLMQRNMAGLREALNSMSEFAKEQAESLGTIQETTRTAIDRSLRISDKRFKITTALLAILTGLILLLGIIAIARLPGG